MCVPPPAWCRRSRSRRSRPLRASGRVGSSSARCGVDAAIQAGQQAFGKLTSAWTPASASTSARRPGSISRSVRPRSARIDPHPQADKNVDQLLAPGVVQVHQPLRAPVDAHLSSKFGVGGGDAARAAAPALAAGAADAAQGHQLGGADHARRRRPGRWPWPRRRPCGCRRWRSP